MPQDQKTVHEAEMAKTLECLKLWRKYIVPRLCLGNLQPAYCLRENFWNVNPRLAWGGNRLTTEEEANQRFIRHCVIAGVDPTTGESNDHGKTLLKSVVSSVLSMAKPSCKWIARDLGQARATHDFYFGDNRMPEHDFWEEDQIVFGEFAKIVEKSSECETAVLKGGGENPELRKVDRSCST